jgi:hypothetical protein
MCCQPTASIISIENELVIAPAQVAVVAAQHRDAVLESGVANPRDGVGVLLGGDGRRRHPAAARRRGMHAEAAPAGPDLQDVVVGAELQLLADALELGDRGLLERHPLALEQRARIRHRRVEHAAEQLVAEVVVGGDVAPAARPVVASQQRPQPLLGRPQRRRELSHAVDHDRVAGGQTDDRDEIRGVPQPRRVGVGKPAAAAHQCLPEPGVAHLDRRRGRAGAELEATRAARGGPVDDDERADADLVQQRAGGQAPRELFTRPHHATAGG